MRKRCFCSGQDWRLLLQMRQRFQRSQLWHRTHHYGNKRYQCYDYHSHHSDHTPVSKRHGSNMHI